MTRGLSILLVISLLGSAIADQFSEVYSKDDSFLKFRDASEFQAPQPELRTVSIEGLPSHQQGYQLVNTQVGQRSQQLTDIQKETIRRQQEFLNSALEPNHPSPAPNSFFGQQQSTSNPPTVTSRLLDSPDFSARPTFKLRGQEQRVTPSTLHTIEFNSFQTEPALINQASGSVIQHVPLSNNMQSERKPIGFEEPVTPSYRGVIQDILKTNVRQNVQPLTEVPHDRFTIRKPAVPAVEQPPRLTGLRISGNEQSVRQPELDNFQRVPVDRVRTNFQSGEDEEARFISQVNQNTAAGASQINNFQSSSQLDNFNALPPASTRGSSRRPVNQNLHQDDSRNANQERKSPVLHTQKPFVPAAEQNQFGAVPSPLSSGQRPSTRLQNGNNAQTEEAIGELESRKQAESAQYNFASSVSDTVNGNSQSRQESRDGLKLTGMYSYSDGFFHRTVYYEADENGYRIVKEENEPIGKGPQYDPNGEVQVDYQHDGSHLNYRIRGDQLKKRPSIEKKKPVSRTGDFSNDYDDQFQLPA